MVDVMEKPVKCCNDYCEKCEHCGCCDPEAHNFVCDGSCQDCQCGDCLQCDQCDGELGYYDEEEDEYYACFECVRYDCE